MADAIMGWDPKQSRWRKTYKKIPLRVRAVDLGGTNRTDTVVAANRWFREQQARIDRELATSTYRPNELEYLAEQESLQSAIKALSAIMRGNPALRPTLDPQVEILKRKEALIKQVLQKPTLPPIDDTFRNPLHISPEHIENAVVKEARQQIADNLREKNITWISDEEIEDTYDNDSMETPLQRSRWNMYVGNLVEHTIENLIQKEAESLVGLKDELYDRKKKELGLIDSEYDRGITNQLLEEHGATVTVSRQLDYHIDKFIEYQKRRHAIGDISAGRLGKILNTIESYKKWKSIAKVDKIGTKDHIDAYFISLGDRVIAGEIKPEYANNLFGTFKMLIDWLVDEEVLRVYPVCLQRKRTKYTFPVSRQKPKTIALEYVSKILDAANPRLKLCILLTLNCGFGASEIGQLSKDEYDPTTGRITHKRCKTKKYANAPTVCYKLWNETKELLDKAIAERINYPQHSESMNYLLVNGNGKPLWSERVEDGKSKKNDNITCDFKRLIIQLQKADLDFPAITYYQFRKTSASLIFNEPRFKMYNELWLAHAPRSVADRHYNSTDDTILDECIDWLHNRFFDTELPLEKGNC